MINTLWVFGDSFSVPTGIVPYKTRQEEVKPDHFNGKYIDKAWYNVILKEIKVNQFKNISQAGGSNLEILGFIIDKLPFIQHDDQVIIGLTGGERILHTWTDAPNNKAFQSFPSPIHVILTDDILKLKVRQGNIFRKESSYIVDQIDNRFNFSDHYKHYEHYPILKLALYIYNFLCRNVIIWTPIMWPLYENITTMTKGKEEDPHWSPDGNKEFGERVLSVVGKGFKVLWGEWDLDGVDYIKKEYYTEKFEKPREKLRGLRDEAK